MTAFRYTPFTVKMIRRHAQTMSAETIAAFMQAPIDMIEMICRKHDITVRERDCFPHDAVKPTPAGKAVRKALEIQIDETMLGIVRRQAKKRGVETITLIETLIERIAEDDLYSAILDR
jgi:hypothetical protein